jgi:hypothetical protein
VLFTPAEFLLMGDTGVILRSDHGQIGSRTAKHNQIRLRNQTTPDTMDHIILGTAADLLTFANATNATAGPHGHTSDNVDNVISYCVTLGLYGVSFVLLLTAFLYNYSYVIFVPSQCGNRSTTSLDTYRTRFTMNWALFLFVTYQLLRILGTGLDTIGEFFLWHPRAMYVSRVSTSIQIFHNQLLLVIISMLVVMWLDIGASLFQSKRVSFETVRITTIGVIVTLNVINVVSCVIGAVANIMGPERNLRFLFGGFLYNIASTYSAVLLALGVLSAGHCIHLLIRIHQSNARLVGLDTSPENGGLGGRVTKQTRATVQKRTYLMVRMTISLFFVFVGMATRLVGLGLVVGSAPKFLYSAFNNGLPDFFVMIAVLFIFWPFAIGSFFKPLTNIRSLNRRNSDGQIAPPSSDEDTAPSHDAGDVELGDKAEVEKGADAWEEDRAEVVSDEPKNTADPEPSTQESAPVVDIVVDAAINEQCIAAV